MVRPPPPEPWKDAVRRNPARLAGTLCGGALAAAGVWLASDHASDAASVAAVGGGAALAGASLLIPYVKRLSILGNTIEARDPANDPRGLPEAVDEVRRRSAEDPESIDVDSLDFPGDDLADGARYQLAERAIELLLTHLDGALAGCEARLFTFDSTLNKLTPTFRPPTAATRPINWAPGQGVVGAAYAEADYVLAVGDATHDDTYGLTPEMQDRFRELTAVAATPVYVRDDVVGVLAISSRKFGTHLTSEEAFWEHQRLAELVSVALEMLADPGSAR